jgi:hypothetical protein
MASDVFRGLLWAKMSQYFMCLRDDDLGQSSLFLNDRWDAQYGFFCVVASIQETVHDLKFLVMPDILQYLGKEGIFGVSLLDLIQYRAVTFHPGA